MDSEVDWKLIELPGSKRCDWSLVGGQSPMVRPKGCYGDKYFLTYLLMIWTECTLSKFERDKHLRGVVDTQGGCAAIQHEFNRLEQWAKRKLMKLNEGWAPRASGDSRRKKLFLLRCQILHLGGVILCTMKVGGQPVGKQFSERSLEHSGGQQINYKPPMCLCSKGGQQSPVLH